MKTVPVFSSRTQNRIGGSAALIAARQPQIQKARELGFPDPQLVTDKVLAAAEQKLAELKAAEGEDRKLTPGELEEVHRQVWGF